MQALDHVANQISFNHGRNGEPNMGIAQVSSLNTAWWRHQMETFSALLAICAGNSPVPGEFPTQRPVTQSFDVFSDLRLNKWLSKQSWGWWFETLSRPLWRHCDGQISTRWNLHAQICYSPTIDDRRANFVSLQTAGGDDASGWWYRGQIFLLSGSGRSADRCCFQMAMTAHNCQATKIVPLSLWSQLCNTMINVSGGLHIGLI